MKYLISILAIILTTSCSYKENKIDLKITPYGKFNKASQGSSLTTLVLDVRQDRDLIGHKKYYKKTINITTNNAISKILKDAIDKNLQDRGFEFDNKRRYLELHILKLNYEAKKGIFIGDSSGTAKIKAIVKNYNKTKIFEKVFDLNLNRKHFIISSNYQDQKTIQNLASEIASDILNDKSLNEQINK